MKQIYIYETEYSKSLIKEVNGVYYTGFKKIGETTGNVHARIMNQFIGVPHNPEEKMYNLLYTTEAKTESGITFSDKNIHEYLRHKQYYNIPESEWFSISLKDVINVINIIKKEPFFKISATGRSILNILKSTNKSFNTNEIAQILQKSNEYTQGEIQKLWKNKLISRSKKYDSTLNIMRFFYSTKDNQIHNKIPSYKKLSKRDNKFLYELNMSLEEIASIIKDCGIKEGIEKMCAVTGYKFSTLEKFLSNVRKELEAQNIITYELGGGYRNLGKIIRKIN